MTKVTTDPSLGNEIIHILSSAAATAGRERSRTDTSFVVTTLVAGTAYRPTRDLRRLIIGMQTPRRHAATDSADQEIQQEDTSTVEFWQDIEMSLREVNWRARRGAASTTNTDTDWPMSVRTALKHTVEEAKLADCTYASATHLLIGLLADPHSAATRLLQRSYVDTDDVVSRLRATPDWRKSGTPHAPTVAVLEAVGGIDSQPRWPLRLISAAMRRSTKKRSRYRGVVGHFLEQEIMRQAIRLDSPLVTSAHAILAMASLTEQLEATGRHLDRRVARYNEGNFLICRRGFTLNESVASAIGNLHEGDALSIEESEVFWSTGLPWSRRLNTHIERAIELAQDRGHDHVGTSHLLTTILQDKDSAGFLLLNTLGYEPTSIIAELSTHLRYRNS